MAGRVTRKAPEFPLTIEERLALAAARQTVADLSEREPSPDHLTELGYEQRMARMKATELAVAFKSAAFGTDIRLGSSAVEIADMFYRFIWDGAVPD